MLEWISALSTASSGGNVKSGFEEFKETISSTLMSGQFWAEALFVLFKIVLVLLIARIIIVVSDKTIQHLIKDREDSRLKIDPRRTRTIGKLIRNIITYAINFIAILLILSQLNINLAPLLAGAGIVGLAIGFGAQSLVKDVITGFFIIFEDQFAVGDVIQVNQFKGTVEEIGLRVTKIRSWTGEVHILPNGSITEVTNFSVHNTLAVIDVTVAFEADVQKAMDLMKQTVDRVHLESEEIVKPPEVLGVQALGATGVVLRVIAECKPNQHIGIGRKLNLEIKRAFDEAGIEIAYPRMVTYHRQEAKGGA